MIDTLHAVEKLQSAGFDAPQAKALVGVIAIRPDDYPSRDELNAALEKLRSEIAVFKSDVNAEFRTFRSEMRALEARLMTKLAAMQLASIGVIIAAIRLLGA